MSIQNPFAPAEPVKKRLKVLLYGAASSGKTVAALSWPRPAVIDAEGGTDLYAGRPGYPAFSVLRAKTMTQVKQALAFIKADDGQTFDTLVIDPITSIYEVSRESIARASKTGDMGYREWARLNAEMRTLYTLLTDLPVHVVITAHEAPEYETEAGGNLKKVGTKTDADRKVLYAFDFVIHMQPDHTGVVEKVRGASVGKGGVLKRVDWSAFAALADGYAQGEMIEHGTEEGAVESETARLNRLAAEFENVDAVKSWLAGLAERGITGREVAKALGVESWSAWRGGFEAANVRLSEWILTGSAS